MAFKKDFLTEKQTYLILRMGFWVILIQNSLFLLGGLAISYLSSPYGALTTTIPVLSPDNIVLQIDLVGFFVIGLGYIFLSKQNLQNLKTRNFQIGGLCILGWLIPRIIWQFFLYRLTSGAYPGIYTFQYDLPLVALLLLISAILLAIGTIMIGSTQKGAGGLFIMIFGVLNLVASVLLFFTYFLLGPEPTQELIQELFNLYALTISTKLYIVPAMAIVAFRLLILELPKRKEEPEVSKFDLIAIKQ
ncbi:MAG: hypothetical protein ACFFCZ_18035 [Promethearchaeota archaeon]